MSTTHKVQTGEGAWDITLNETGSLEDLDNLDAILEANGLTDWTPDLAGGQLLTIPDGLTITGNAVRQFAIYPLCNNDNSDVYAQIQAIFDLLADNWILQTGFWNDNAIWIDTKTWIDGI